jgi:uncharacterized membrane protein HdeD (DUF308 family)
MNTRGGLIPRSSPTSLGWPIILILIGVLALALPVATSFAVARILAWVLVFDGVFQLFYAFRSEKVGRILWKVLVAVLYIVGGLYLLANPLLKMAGLTLMLAIFFIVEGIMDLSTYLFSPKTEGSHWLLVHSAVTILLGFMIWRRWPVSSLWAVGILAGVSIFLSGFTRLMLVLAIRRHAV